MCFELKKTPKKWTYEAYNILVGSHQAFILLKVQMYYKLVQMMFMRSCTKFPILSCSSEKHDVDGNYWNRTMHLFLIQSSDAELKKCIYDYLSKLKLPIFTLQEFCPFLYNLHDIFFMPPQKKRSKKKTMVIHRSCFCGIAWFDWWQCGTLEFVIYLFLLVKILEGSLGLVLHE